MMEKLKVFDLVGDMYVVLKSDLTPKCGSFCRIENYEYYTKVLVQDYLLYKYGIPKELTSYFMDTVYGIFNNKLKSVLCDEVYYCDKTSFKNSGFSNDEVLTVEKVETFDDGDILIEDKKLISSLISEIKSERDRKVFLFFSRLEKTKQKFNKLITILESIINDDENNI